MDKAKQFLTTLLMAAAIFFLLQYFMGKGGCRGKPSAEEPTTKPAATQAGGAGENAWAYGGKFLTAAQARDTRTERILLGSLDPDGDYAFQAELDPRGASVYALKLAGHYDTDDHKRHQDKTEQQLQEWSYPLLNPIVEEGQTILPFSTQSVKIGDREVATFLGPRQDIWVRRKAGAGGSETRPADTDTRPTTPEGYEKANGHMAWSAVRAVDEELPGNRHFIRTEADGTQSVTFRLKLFGLPPEDETRIEEAPLLYTLEKTYTLAKGADFLDVSLRVINHTADKQSISVVQYGPTGAPREGLRSDMRNTLAGKYLSAKKKITVPKVVKDVAKKSAGDEEDMGGNDDTDPILWCGQGNQFFASLMYVEPAGLDLAKVDESTDPADLVVPEDQSICRFFSRVVRENSESNTQLVVFRGDSKDVPSNGVAEWKFHVYCGPKSRTRFKDTPLYAKLGYTGAIQFAGCSWCMFDWMAFSVMWFIERVGAFLGNYGLAIILLVVLIRTALHPISKKSQINMRKMSKLSPAMEKIKEKYADDKAAQQKAIMELFREQGATPILGCLPMLLQMPIWVALWSGLQAAVELRHEGLLPFWITDLAGRDALITFGRAIDIPLVGPVGSLNLLPILLAAAMVLQQKFTPMQTATTPEQQSTQRMTMVLMPVMMLLFFYNAPSGLTLYIMVSTASGVIESWVIRKHLKEKEELEAASEVRVRAPGKAPRGQRPKKPKGLGGFRYK